MYMDTDETLEILSERMDHLEAMFGSLVQQLKKNRTLTADDICSANKEIKERMQKYGIRQWRLADAICTSEQTVSKMLRTEMSDTKKEQVLRVLERLHLDDVRLINSIDEEIRVGGETR